MRLRTISLTALFALGLANAALAQSFLLDTTSIPSGNPANNSTTEDFDFGDIDLDGDFDCAFADGGDDFNDQNRIWVNLGGLQAGIEGTFVDETALRAPAVQDDSRDIEFVDYDGDGDLDSFTSNTAQISNQGARFWDNAGGAQDGTLGFFLDATSSRWIGLGGPGSSISPNLILGQENNYINWSHEADFADLDNDGDPDLVNTSYGGAFGGSVPTRIFLNDGDGHFQEFNPNGFQLTSSNIANGDPGLWCEGRQSANTLNSTGFECDIATVCIDVELADFDGDLDIDILLNDLDGDPRYFDNRLELGTLSFRDETGVTVPRGATQQGGHFEQEAADMDNDDDVDVYGVNWLNETFAINDATIENVDGIFQGPYTVPGSAPDDQHADFIDYDNDGDLDVIVGNFSGANRLYTNTFLEDGAAFEFAEGLELSDELPSVSPNYITLDVDVADVDSDGDYDFLEANDSLQPNRLFRNVTQVPDAVAPRVVKLEALSSGPPTAAAEVLRVQVYDNAPHYVTRLNTTALLASVDGIPLAPRSMASTQGQIFRGLLPGNLVGSLEVHARSSDRYGNSGTSNPVQVVRAGDTGATIGGSSAGLAGQPTVRSLTEAFGGAALIVVAENFSPSAAVVVAFALSDQGPGGLDLGDGLILNLGLPTIGEPLVLTADLAGRVVLELEALPNLPGLALRYQAIGADGAGGATWASTQALALTLQ